MPINKNTTALSAIYKGSSLVSKAYLGTDQIYPNILPSYSVDYLVVAGGGGGGLNPASGGGGAGGFLTSTLSDVFSGDSLTIIVGSGGSTDSNGANSSLNSILSIGGGAGGSNPGNGLTGGSGGGGTQSAVGGSGTIGQGNIGGNGRIGSGADCSGDGYNAGGGGGAGAVGGNGVLNNGGSGGNGLISNILSYTSASSIPVGEIVGTDVYYSGGGAGGGDSYRGATKGTGGLGGGGDSGIATNSVQCNPAIDSQAGLNNSGGGGGGANNGSGTGSTGKNGGSGVVILRMPTASYSGNTTGSPTVTTDGTDTILIYTGSGTYTA